ncbi:nuclear transport factor 2 family protein [uncultured Flavobacterium sp.]|uniref:nuclear transport factor 2 family protein n=1 Tax=uncultured Flavobacterium sp. TaxID=165435 RepID=UPI0025D8A800|nr:nuclear transport factor 2 family protein [uncultured Flavobacterium sp.]
MKSESIIDIQGVIFEYFSGVFEGNVTQLKNTFEPNAILYGDIKGEPYLKSFQDYVKGVADRKSPKELGEEFKMKIISIEVFGNNAMVKAQLPMLGYNYYDFLSLTKLNGDWKIVNKLFTHQE